MAKKLAASFDSYFEKFLEEKFDRVFDQLDEIKSSRDRRDRDVNLMDTTNKAEIKAVKDRVIAVETQLGNVKFLLNSAMWVVTGVGVFISWALGVWGHIASALKNVT
ncbi:hypothetical protein ELG64_09075 [Rhizobium leguminosarum]|uniref:hypothetical protein n=1 Tax=Rhizobium leguminosarum TaxID=384 RepID=UPI00103204ED|nr:hypothetical protein [Rhizobium leguminosarum]TBH23646.1 hypothetical protein ELG64_09075 [Rhizobium leguminosarum]